MPSVNDVGRLLAGPNSHCKDLDDGHTQCTGAAFVPPDSAAFTMGDVILVRSDLDLDPGSLTHEENHSNQWAAWGGWGFATSYGLDWVFHEGRVECQSFETAAGQGKEFNSYSGNKGCHNNHNLWDGCLEFFKL